MKMKLITLIALSSPLLINTAYASTITCNSLGGTKINNIYGNSIALERYNKIDKVNNEPRGIFNKEEDFSANLMFQYKQTSSYSPYVKLEIIDKNVYNDLFKLIANRDQKSLDRRLTICYDDPSNTVLGFTIDS